MARKRQPPSRQTAKREQKRRNARRLNEAYARGETAATARAEAMADLARGR